MNDRSQTWAKHLLSLHVFLVSISTTVRCCISFTPKALLIYLPKRLLGSVCLTTSRPRQMLDETSRKPSRKDDLETFIPVCANKRGVRGCKQGVRSGL
ncbi:hypothetical protein C8J56DRAFT_962969 [Mycena floridula]|nr:hypothetical protein C8J56DRAFT_962969 [Mycena floridula]